MRLQGKWDQADGYAKDASQRILDPWIKIRDSVGNLSLQEIISNLMNFSYAYVRNSDFYLVMEKGLN